MGETTLRIYTSAQVDLVRRVKGLLNEGIQLRNAFEWAGMKSNEEGTTMTSDYITFEHLCTATGLTKHRLRYFQITGFFKAEGAWNLTERPCPDCVYDARWIALWEEAEEYARAGFALLGALKEARKDVFYGK
jgi:hypothetical protein